MRKLMSFNLSLVMILALLLTGFNAYASESEPYINNADKAQVGFNISSSGKADAVVKFKDLNNGVKSVKIVVKVQKKVGLIWSTVDNGSWTLESKSSNYSKVCSVQLNKKGTYRAHVVFTISGTGGKDDKITKNVEKTYS